MAITFTGTKLPQTELQKIQQEIYADWGTFRDQDVDIDEGHKSSADVYESKVTVNRTAYSSGAVGAGSDTLNANKTAVSLVKTQFADTIDYNTLLDTRFEKSMARGAFNLVSNEFDNAVLQYITPAISEVMENETWNGDTTAHKALVAGLTPGAPQGSISAGAQTLVAAMPTTLTSSFPAIILHNDSQSKAAAGAGVGEYKKVLSIASITSATIAAEYAKMYAVIDPKVIAQTNLGLTIFAPLAHRQLMMIANNSVGAASNKNFTFTGDALTGKVFYNGIEVKFKPLVGFMIAAPKSYLKILLDLKGDMADLNIGKTANGADTYWYKNTQAFATWVTNQRYIVLYGG